MTETTSQTTRLEFYLPAGRRVTLIKRGTWFGLTREISRRALR
ncbi:MAG: hypothetical protein ABWY93_29880 [Mycobacterium sp.]